MDTLIGEGSTLSEAIRVEHLSYEYPGVDDTPGVRVFEDLSLSVEEGSFVAVLGSNGCGKSTLAKHFNSILLPSGGKVYVGGLDTSDEELLIRVRRMVGMVFQNPDNQIVANVVEEDVAFGPENLGVASPEIRKRVDQALKQVGMYEFRAHAPHLLSGGQKQRVAIAGVIAMEPKCIVLDEPTAMLDPRGRREVVETVLKLNREKQITVVLITHHMDEAAKAKRVVVLHKGKVAADGAPKQVFSQVELLHQIGLAAPETTELCYALNKEGFSLPLDALETDECAQALFNEVKV
jgi:energy-coupling factor transport system ATP-binding protein